MTRDLDALTGRLSTISDAEAAQLVTDRGELSRQITTLHPPDVPQGRPSRRPSLMLPASVAATLVAGAIFATADLTERVPQPEHTPTAPAAAPENLLPPNRLAAALSFTKSKGHVEVIVRDLTADPGRYRAELARRGLKVDLRLAPVKPAQVGAVLFMEVDDVDRRPIEALTATGECHTDGGGNECPIGVRIPADYRGTARIVMGRATGTGEAPEGGGEEFTAPGEYHGVKVRGRLVSDVLADLRRKGVTVTEFRYEDNGSDKPYPNGLDPEQVKPDWYVHDVAAGSRNEPIMFVGPDADG